jgi:hypothetical protein
MYNPMYKLMYVFDCINKLVIAFDCMYMPSMLLCQVLHDDGFADAMAWLRARDSPVVPTKRKSFAAQLSERLLVG